VTAEAPADASDDLIIDSATGVEVRLRVAGSGTRAYAFLIDWHIRLILALSWFVVAALIYNRRLSIATPFEPDAAWFGLVLAPPAVIFFLYHYVLEVAMRGRTPGKRMAGVRIVRRDGNAPSAGALLARNVFRLIDSFPMVYSVGLVTTMLTRNHVRIGDLAAGTLLVHELVRSPLASYAISAIPDGEIVSELLGRWSALDPAARERLARGILSRHGVMSPPEAGEAQLRSELERLLQRPAA
jgi:uncharacterized RDD family membrane protein YckC